MTTINITGAIIDEEDRFAYAWYGLDYTTASDVDRRLERANGDVTVIINSQGGSVYAANQIYHSLKKYGQKNKVTTEIAGVAFSAASYIALAGNDVAMSHLAQFMIHNAAGGNYGDHRSMDKASELLLKTNQSIVKAYAVKTGIEEKELLNMMAEETFMTAEEALEKGFVDRIMHNDTQIKLTASNKGELLPQNIVQKMRENKHLFSNEGQKKVTEPAITPKEDPKNNEKGSVKMTYEEIKEQYPEIFNQIKDEGVKEGVSQENARIKNIDSLANTGMTDLLNAAKYEKPMDAGQLAIAILNKQQEIGKNHEKKVEEDAKNLDQVNASAADDEENKKAQAVAQSVTGLENIFKNGGVL
ncbi:ATP-dependent Clp protease proteolytic subunit [Metalysinibacillus saudimassiliensis]|uniref:ATP-dependent Clp protease proteolytic subunit n=1 Tax=Metalysinibacillus saudimassiliensis TaxID=1461583 RepID=A0A078MK03_9BACL|nr:ATP-dependent Clp protease proteolytic subunit [Metalysinibacillus saudimassiliensis]